MGEKIQLLQLRTLRARLYELISSAETGSLYVYGELHQQIMFIIRIRCLMHIRTGAELIENWPICLGGALAD